MLNALDGILIGVALLAFWQGVYQGFLRQIFSIVGFWGGIFLGVTILKYLPLTQFSATYKLLITLSVVLGLGAILGTVGQYIGNKSAIVVNKLHLKIIDQVLGGILNTATILLVAWIILNLIPQGLVQGLGSEMASSQVAKAMNDYFPPAPNIVASVQGLLDQSNFPKVFAGLYPEPAAPVVLPDNATMRAVAEAAQASTVKVTGTACNEDVEGSGFVIAANIVVTNAHVVAGVTDPVIHDEHGDYHATVVLFDPEVDLAVLKTSNLHDPSLSFVSGDVDRGAQGVVVGYPENGPYTGTVAGVLRRIEATGRDIYNQNTVTREVYELQANVEPGNSGGPLLDTQGHVLGIVFARSESTTGVGYALTENEVSSEVQQGIHSTATQSTGACTTD